MIPKLIHQTAKTSEIPEKWRGYQARLKELHPGWTYKLWTDEDNHAFVKKEYPDFLAVYNDLPKNIMRADVIRYLLLYRLGGMYMDLDFEMLKPFDLVEHDIVLPQEKTKGAPGETEDLVANAFLASAPGHPFWKLAIDDLAAHPPMEEKVVENATGPGFLSRIYSRAVASGMQIYCPPREWFSPRTPRGRREYNAIVKKNVSYGIHHCHGSWRERTLRQRIKMRLGGIYHRLFN